MKQPRKPLRQPRKPSKPTKPKQTIVEQHTIDLTYKDSISIADIVKEVRDTKVKNSKTDIKTLPLEDIILYYNQGYDIEYGIIFSVTIDNVNYEKELVKYEGKMVTYEKSMEQYKRALAKYNEYNKTMTDQKKAARIKKEIDKLQKELQRIT